MTLAETSLTSLSVLKCLSLLRLANNCGWIPGIGTEGDWNELGVTFIENTHCSELEQMAGLHKVGIKNLAHKPNSIPGN